MKNITMKTNCILRPAALLLALTLFLPLTRATPISRLLLNTNNGHYYLLLSQSTWPTAEAEAVSLGGHLATVRNQTEEDWIYAQFSQFSGQGRELWVGLNDLLSTGNYVWVSGESAAYRNWAPGEPSSGEHYVAIWGPPISNANKWNNYGNVSADGTGAPINGVAEFTTMPWTTVVPAGSVWKYLDNGIDQGTAWKESNFNDSAWASGPAQLGYGDGDEATVVSYGPSSTNKYVTTYFRRSFYLASTSFITDLAVRLLRDDGAVVYLNGVEIFRSNMPSGAVSSTTLAAGTDATADENSFHTYAVPPPVLHAGTNLFAVEIHQATVNSSDISFDLELIANSALVKSADPLPPPWFELDVGGPGVAGGASYVTNRPVWMVQGGGADIWNTSDQLHYVYQTITGDWDIRARVVNIGNTVARSKAGVMFRESLSASAKHVHVDMTPGHGVEFVFRSATGGTSTYQGQTDLPLPYWVRSIRLGNTFTGYCSSNGLDWSLVYSVTITMSNQIYAGLAVCAYDNTKACMTAFDQVSGLSTNWSQQDIGSPGISGSAFVETNAPTFLVQGGGADITGALDEAHYILQPVVGNCAIQTRVGVVGRASDWSKAGVIMRETLRGDSTLAMMVGTPSHGAFYQWRSTGGSFSGWSGESTDSLPCWLRIVRRDNLFTGYKSVNGTDWTQVYSAVLSMADQVEVGLTVTALDNSGSCLTAFDSVAFVPVVNLITAVDGDTFYLGDPIEFHADAAVLNGQIMQVKYYSQDTNLIGAASSPPYAVIWPNAQPGMNYVSARAVDDKGVEGAPLTHAVFVAEMDTHVRFYSDFASSGGSILQGDAGTTNGRLRICQGQANSVGGAWLNQPINVANGFETVFQFQINSVYGNADGFALVLLGAPSQPSLGGHGSGLGYDGLANSLALEFDTYQNPDNGDPNACHIGFHTRGTLANSYYESVEVARVNNPPNFLDGLVHTAKITYSNALFRVFLDDLRNPILALSLSLASTLNLPDGTAWAGFTAGTGGYYENHDILNWSFATTNLHPFVSLISPTNGAIFQPTDPIALSAAATDPDGSIQYVVFFVDGGFAGVAPLSPWQLPVGTLPAGPHVLSAAALDDTEAAAVSAPVTVMVQVPLSIETPAQKTNGLFHVRFAGTPAGTYTIVSAPAVNGPWSPFTNSTVGPNGWFDLFDTAVATQRFYRTTMP